MSGEDKLLKELKRGRDDDDDSNAKRRRLAEVAADEKKLQVLGYNVIAHIAKDMVVSEIVKTLCSVHERPGKNLCQDDRFWEIWLIEERSAQKWQEIMDDLYDVDIDNENSLHATFDIALKFIRIDKKKNFLRYAIGYKIYNPRDMRYPNREPWRRRFLLYIGDLKLRREVVFFMLMHNMTEYNYDQYLMIATPLPYTNKYNDDIKDFLISAYVESCWEPTASDETVRSFALAMARLIGDNVQMSMANLHDWMRKFNEYNFNLTSGDQMLYYRGVDLRHLPEFSNFFEEEYMFIDEMQKEEFFKQVFNWWLQLGRDGKDPFITTLLNRVTK